MGVRAGAEDLLRDADIAMYRAKRAGKNGYVVFEPGMEEAVQSHVVDLRDADDDGELFLVYKYRPEMAPTGI
jgi:predicted signal transduction protein with EAL and GGDEF domain